MSTLSDDDRRALARAIERARGFAEEGAREALVQHTVGDAKPGVHLDEAGRRLRNKLRAHARQLGDHKRDDGTHTIERLVGECAYAHWHRMLFARFLAENSLLWHPDGYPVSLEELEEWAKEWDLRSRWEAAERCAAQILPQIFGGNTLVLSVALSMRSQKFLEETLEGIPSDVFKARDALGWVYQFWQSAEKERIYETEAKIGADELPAVTQLFTEPYMVDFLLQNTLGAWWIGRHGRDHLPVEMPYLRFLDDGTPAAGMFETWPEAAKDLTVLDPCCGSGHFLVAAFDLLVRFRMREEQLLPRVAAELVIRDNLHGLELDPRCTQIAAFAVAFAAWTFPEVEQYYQLPELHIACVGLGIRSELSDWLALANGNTKFRAGLERLYAQFKNAPLLGSLIDPTAARDSLLEASFESIRPLLDEALKSEKWSGSDDASEMGATAHGITKAASLLAAKYTLVCTNPPYLGSKKQDPKLFAFLSSAYPLSFRDLYTVFVERQIELCADGGAVVSVTPHNWLILKGASRLRAALLGKFSLSIVAGLGPAAFREMNWWASKTALIILRKEEPTDATTWTSLDLGEHKRTAEKPELIQNAHLTRIQQTATTRNPDAAISLSLAGAPQPERLLGAYAGCYQGVSTGDSRRFVRFFWEIGDTGKRWAFFQGPPTTTGYYVAREEVVLRDVVESDSYGATVRGADAWGKQGVLISQMRLLPATLYGGSYFSNSCPVIVPNDGQEEILPALWCYISSESFRTDLRKLNSKNSVDNGYVTKIEFDLARWTAVAAEKYADGLPSPHSDDPTQWVFKGDIPNATRPLQVAVARLVGYRWPDQPPSAVIDTLADNDGIVCVPAVRQERPAADRLLDLLVKAYGARWTTDTLPELLAREGATGLTLDVWLRDRFFESHCALFHQRPFVWQVWDGEKDGFSALLHYQRLTPSTMRTLIYTDLGDWIDRQETGVKAGAMGAEVRLVAAKKLRAKLEAILEGEKPHDIFVRWKPLDAQPLGWEPDLDDGVRLNIRPFVEANVLRTPAKNLKGIDWRKDRGKDSTTAPWHKRFDGERINDHHTTLAEKRAARAAKKGSGS